MTKLATDTHRHPQTIFFPRATLPEEKLYALDKRGKQLNQNSLKVGSILSEFIGNDVFSYIFYPAQRDDSFCSVRSTEQKLV